MIRTTDNMKYAILSSGSKGNATIVSDGKTNILIDCGISKKMLNDRLLSCGLSLCDVDYVLITHGHSDHIKSVGIFPPKKVYASLLVLGPVKDDSNILCSYTRYSFGNTIVTPFPLSHDATNTTGFIVESGDEKLVYVTDTGFISDKALSLLTNANYYIFESNHDPKMLCESNRPAILIKRILGDQGHLSNIESAYYLSNLIGQNTSEITLAHLSEECNTPEKAIETFDKVMMSQRGEIPQVLLRCADQNNVFKGGDWLKNEIKQ